MSACTCRCHASSGTHVSCDVGPVQPGGNRSCTMLHDGDAETEALPADKACVLGHADPTERFVGLLCRRHYHRIDATLHEIEELFSLLPEVILPSQSGDGRGGTPDGSPSPGRLDVMVLTDTRNVPWKELTGWGQLYNPPSADALDFRSVLASWVQQVLDESSHKLRDDSDDTGPITVSEGIRYLRRERKWIAWQPWIGDYADELHDLHRALAAATGAGMWPQSLGTCPNCGAKLYPTIGVDEVTCRRCKTTWRGTDLARLRLIHEQEKRR